MRTILQTQARSKLLFFQPQQPFSQYVASIDQSTTSTKFSIFQTDGKLLEKQIIEHEQISLNEGWLEHNPNQIVSNTYKSISNVIQRMKKRPNFNVNQIVGLGICNQRQTVVCWDENGQPIGNAIVWCDSRTLDICQRFQQQHGSFSHLTGLPVSTYFSLFKILWMLENNSQIRAKYQNGKLKFGTIDSWLAYNLTGKHVTDASNASRTYLCDIHKSAWDPNLLKIAKLNQNSLPQIVDSFQSIGKVKKGDLQGVELSSILGDQQSSAFAHSLKINEMKITYGTGCFMLSNIGDKPQIDNSFVTTILHKHKDKITYGLEASVECGGGTINWAKRLGLFHDYKQLSQLSEVADHLYFFPSFGSIYSPFWKTGVKGGLEGLNFNTKREHILQALLESITFRLNDNIKNQKFKDVKKIVVDGGMTINKKFMQLQADTFQGKKIQVRELDTCWGVAKGVLVSKGQNISEIKEAQTNYEAKEQSEQIQKRYEKWCEARKQFYGWK